jgi:excisionase family DNA binding protein
MPLLPPKLAIKHGDRRMSLSPPPGSPATVSVNEACRQLNVGRTKMYELILPRQGPPEIDSFKIGRSRRVIVTSLYDYMNRRLQQ